MSYVKYKKDNLECLKLLSYSISSCSGDDNGNVFIEMRDIDNLYKKGNVIKWRIPFYVSIITSLIALCNYKTCTEYNTKLMYYKYIDHIDFEHKFWCDIINYLLTLGPITVIIYALTYEILVLFLLKFNLHKYVYILGSYVLNYDLYTIYLFSDNTFSIIIDYDKKLYINIYNNGELILDDKFEMDKNFKKKEKKIKICNIIISVILFLLTFIIVYFISR